MPTTRIIKCTIAIILLLFLYKLFPSLTTLSISELATRSFKANYILTTVNAADLSIDSLSVSKVTNKPVIIVAKNYNLDATGVSDTSSSFQKMVDSFPGSSTIQLPKGKYKLSSTV